MGTIIQMIPTSKTDYLFLYPKTGEGQKEIEYRSSHNIAHKQSEVPYIDIEKQHAKLSLYHIPLQLIDKVNYENTI